jgi:hypothetical protein
VSDEARCSLAGQHEQVVRGLLDHFSDEVRAHMDGTATPVEPVVIAELVDISDDTATIDENHQAKQPDWTYDETYSGKTPVERFMEPSVR